MSPGVLLSPTPTTVSILKLNVLRAFDPADLDLTETLRFSSGKSHSPVPPEGSAWLALHPLLELSSFQCSRAPGLGLLVFSIYIPSLLISLLSRFQLLSYASDTQALTSPLNFRLMYQMLNVSTNMRLSPWVHWRDCFLVCLFLIFIRLPGVCLAMKPSACWVVQTRGGGEHYIDEREILKF